jgi:hypothetical protein
MRAGADTAEVADEAAAERVAQVGVFLGIEPARTLPNFISGLILLLTTQNVSYDTLFTSSSGSTDSVYLQNTHFSIEEYAERESGFVTGLLSALHDYGADASWRHTCHSVLQHIFGITDPELAPFVEQHPLEACAELYEAFPVKQLHGRVSNLVSELQGWEDSPSLLLILNYATQTWIQYGIMGAPEAVSIENLIE